MTRSPRGMGADDVGDRVGAHCVLPSPVRATRLRPDAVERVEDAVDEPVLQRLLRGVPAVAGGVVADPLERLAGVLGDQPEHRLHGVPQVVGLQLDVDGRPADAGRPLVHEDPGVPQGVALAVRPRREEELARAAGESEGEGRHVVGDQPDRVVDREHGRHRAAGGVDPEADVGPRVLGGQQEELGAEAGAAVVVELAVEDDDPLLEQPGGEVVGRGERGAGGFAHAATVGPRSHGGQHFLLRAASLLGAASLLVSSEPAQEQRLL